MLLAGGKNLKPEYEKPTAVPLGEAAKGSGQCNAGSGVGGVVGLSTDCTSGGIASTGCWLGSVTCHSCSGGTSPNGVCYSGGYVSSSCGTGDKPNDNQPVC
jgi:hypothetical protein